MANETVLDVLNAAVSALQAGQRAALLTIVRSHGSTPRHSGAKMLLRQDGTQIGTIGGGTLEEAAVRDAHVALKQGRSAFNTYELSGRTADSVGLCGGAVEVSIEVLMPAAQLVIIGAGHIAQPLAAMAGMIGMDVNVIDDRADWATRARFPQAKELHVVSYDRATETLAALPVQITPSTAIVVATWGWDEPALRQVLASPAFYIGLIGSKRKLAFMAEILQQHGADMDLFTRVHAPIGLDLGGETPGEIALSIIAEIQLVRHGASGQPIHALR
jgi:xanthine dehydrogenase accessory factor